MKIKTDILQDNFRMMSNNHFLYNSVIKDINDVCSIHYFNYFDNSVYYYAADKDPGLFRSITKSIPDNYKKDNCINLVNGVTLINFKYIKLYDDFKCDKWITPVFLDCGTDKPNVSADGLYIPEMFQRSFFIVALEGYHIHNFKKKIMMQVIGIMRNLYVEYGISQFNFDEINSAFWDYSIKFHSPEINFIDKYYSFLMSKF